MWGCIKHWVLKENIYRMTFVNSNIPALKMEQTRKLRQSIHLHNILKTATRTALFQNGGGFSMKPCSTLGQVQTD